MENTLDYIIPPVPRELLKAELSNRNWLRHTHYGDKDIYVTTAHLSPNLMQEIGRLRELSFALAGGGTGKPVDIDEFDTLPDPYCFKQLIVWSPEDEAIVGGYRFIHGSNVLRSADKKIHTPTAELFHFTDTFIEQYLPYTLELGRSFVQPDYQPGNNLRKGMYSLDNLWDGLASVAMEVPETRYFFGKVTMYPQMNRRAKDLVLYFYQKHFPDREGLIWPLEPLEIESDFNELHRLFCGRNYKEDYQILQREVRQLGANVPPLVNAYMGLSSNMVSFGTAYNHAFGETDETGILVSVRDIYPEKRKRYMESYDKRNHHLERHKLFHINLKRMPWWGKSSEGEERELLLGLKRMRIARDRANQDPADGMPARRGIQRREQRRARRQERRARRRQRRNGAE